jgi:hypothetical protein
MIELMYNELKVKYSEYLMRSAIADDYNKHISIRELSTPISQINGDIRKLEKSVEKLKAELEKRFKA